MFDLPEPRASSIGHVDGGVGMTDPLLCVHNQRLVQQSNLATRKQCFSVRMTLRGLRPRYDVSRRGVPHDAMTSVACRMEDPCRTLRPIAHQRWYVPVTRCGNSIGQGSPLVQIEGLLHHKVHPTSLGIIDTAAGDVSRNRVKFGDHSGFGSSQTHGSAPGRV